MKVYYYYHIPKTGGTTIAEFLRFLSLNLPNSKYYQFVSKPTSVPLNIDFNEILSLDNIKKYDYIFIHHHHGYYGLMHYEKLLIEKKKELENAGHLMKIFTTIRDVLSFNNSRLNYLNNNFSMNLKKSDFLCQEKHFNIQSKYIFFGHHGEFPKGGITIDKINNQLTKTNLLKITNVIDIFIETKNLSYFIYTMAKTFNLNYNSNAKKNKNKHSINFNGEAKILLNLNKFDYFLLENFKNDMNHEFKI